MENQNEIFMNQISPTAYKPGQVKKKIIAQLMQKRTHI